MEQRQDEPTPLRVELGQGYLCDRNRTTLYRRDKDDEDKLVPVLHPRGMPVLHRVWIVGGTSDRPAPEETYYEISWPALGEQVYRFKQRELDSGECWARWAVLGITSSKARNLYADIVKEQAVPFHMPVEVAPRFTGMQPPDGRQGWRYVRPDGQVVTLQPTGATSLPVHHYRMNADTARFWERMMPDLSPDAPTGRDLEWLADTCQDIDPKGRLLAIIGCGLRGLIATLLPVRTALLAVGESGAGKTTECNVGRCVNGMYPHQAVGDVNLGDFTRSGPESQIAPIRDSFLLVDDGRKRGEESFDENRLRDLLDSFFTAAADDCEIRTRANRDMAHKEGTYIKAFLAVTAEYLPALSVSRLRRIMVFQYGAGEVNHNRFRRDHDDLKRVVTRGGTALLRRMLTRLEQGEGKAVAPIADWEQRKADQLYTDLKRLCPRARDEFVRSLAQNYARPLTGLWLLQRACVTLEPADDGSLVDHLYDHLIEMARAQLDLIERGAANDITDEWLRDTAKAEFRRKNYYFTDRDGAPLALTEHWHPDDWGSSESQFTRGQHIGYLMEEDGIAYAYLRPDVARRMWYEAAVRERKTWQWSAQEFPGKLRARGVTTKANPGRNTLRKRFGNEDAKFLVIPLAWFDDPTPPDDDPLPPFLGGDTPSGNSGNSGNSQPPARHSTGQSVFPLAQANVPAAQPAGTEPNAKREQPRPGIQRPAGTHVPAVPAVPAHSHVSETLYPFDGPDKPTPREYCRRCGKRGVWRALGEDRHWGCFNCHEPWRGPRTEGNHA